MADRPFVNLRNDFKRFFNTFITNFFATFRFFSVSVPVEAEDITSFFGDDRDKG